MQISESLSFSMDKVHPKRFDVLHWVKRDGFFT